MVSLTDKAIDVRDLTYFNFLSNLQGNILKGHGRNFTNNIFVHFHAGRQKAVRNWLHAFAGSHVTCALTQLRETEQFQRNHVSGGVFSAVLLSASGYRYLEKTDELPGAFEPSFVNGMKNAALNDPKPSTWDAGFGGDIHAMILIADSDPEKVNLLAKSVIDELRSNDTEGKSPLANILTIEYGNAIRNANGDGLEHFGYVDGISQPLFLKDDVDEYNQRLVPVYQPAANKVDVAAELGLVIVPDPLAPASAEDAFGSYFVFRKLEQKVRAFKEHEKKLAKKLDLVDDDKERAGAMIIGRFEDGTPVTLSAEAGIFESGMANNFDYADDAQGAKCPFHAHIRKSNPRRPGDNLHMMARRGIPFGHRGTNTDIDPDFEQMPTGGVGLLFMSYQHSLADQFEVIQKDWVNDPDFPSTNTGKDPLIGETNPPTNQSIGSFPGVWNDPSSLKQEAFHDFVTMRGGEYFFAPSIAYLTNL